MIPWLRVMNSTMSHGLSHFFLFFQSSESSYWPPIPWIPSTGCRSIHKSWIISWNSSIFSLFFYFPGPYTWTQLWTINKTMSIWLLFQFQKQQTSFNSGLLSMTTFHRSCSIPQAIKYPRRSLQHLENSKFLWPLPTSLVYDLWSGPQVVN